MAAGPTTAPTKSLDLQDYHKLVKLIKAFSSLLVYFLSYCCIVSTLVLNKGEYYIQSLQVDTGGLDGPRTPAGPSTNSVNQLSFAPLLIVHIINICIYKVIA